MKFNRILLKLSGGALVGKNNESFDKEKLEAITDQIVDAKKNGIEVAIVIGGGNIFRGKTAKEWNMERADADNIGMMATIVNALMLKGALDSKISGETVVMNTISIPLIGETYIRRDARKLIDEGKILIFGGGMGHPFITTDYGSVQRAIETKCDAVLMAKSGTNGVYTADPRKDEKAKRFKNLNYEDAINSNLQVADLSAFVLAREFKMPLYVFDFDEKDAVRRVCNGEEIGTYVGEDCNTELYE